MGPSRPSGSESSGFAAAEAWFAEQELPLPDVPARRRADMRELSPGIFGTRDDASSLYDPATYAAELGTGRPADYILMGLDGYGINSWAIHYYAVTGGFGVFVQRLWGGAYTPGEDARAEVTRAFAGAGRLVREAEAALADGTLSGPARLLVLDSDLVPGSWIVLPEPVEDFEALAGSPLWRQTPEPTEAALAFLRERG
jgi:hypothetical protein